jgi:flagellum-specific ATP synthase
VFARLPQLVERAGNAEEGGGSITAFYTVLTEGDDQQDPVADSSRAILDGHFVLNRKLAEEGHYPAIDIEQSISRVMPQVVSEEHLLVAQKAKQLWATYSQNKDLISIGAYQAGSNLEIDQAVKMQPIIRDFLRQGLKEQVNYEQSSQLLKGMMQGANPKAESPALKGGRPIRKQKPAPQSNA